MSFLSRIFLFSRHKSAARRVALDPSPENYLALAHQSVVRGKHVRVEAICQEALAMFPEHSELLQVSRRAVHIRLNERVRQLEKELAVAPRPALWSELFEAHMEVGRFVRASQVARRWRKVGGAGEALYLESRGSLGAFLAGGILEDGALAWSLGQRAASALPIDPRPLETLITLCRRVEAHAERQTLLARLLELRPGQPELESAFRDARQQSAGAPPIQRALENFTRRGCMAEEAECAPLLASGGGSTVRSLLKTLARGEGVRVATYHRGGTALVQGLTGPSADRTARAVRDCARKTRELSARVGLGRFEALCVEGSGEMVLLSADKVGLASLWCAAQSGQEMAIKLDHLAQQGGVSA